MRNDQNSIVKQLLRYRNMYEHDEELLTKIECAAFDNISADKAIDIIRALLDEDEREVDQ
jgi:hypothetical protein